MDLLNLFRRQSPRWLFYDCEIINVIPNPNLDTDPTLTYCEGWHDHKGMGISCIATYSNWDNAYRVFDWLHIKEFQKLVNQSDRVIGFNSKSFDDRLCAANNLKVTTDYDLLSQVWVAAGLPATYTKGLTIAGYSLEKLAMANFGTGKTGSGELAPRLFQEGKHEAVLGYCMNDVFLSVELLKLGWGGKLKDPVTGEFLQLTALT